MSLVRLLSLTIHFSSVYDSFRCIRLGAEAVFFSVCIHLDEVPIYSSIMKVLASYSSLFEENRSLLLKEKSSQEISPQMRNSNQNNNEHKQYRP